MLKKELGNNSEISDTQNTTFSSPTIFLTYNHPVTELIHSSASIGNFSSEF